MNSELVLMLMFNYPEVVVWRDGDGVEELASPTVPQADLVLARHHNYVLHELFSIIPRTWSAQQTKFPSRSRET